MPAEFRKKLLRNIFFVVFGLLLVVLIFSGRLNWLVAMIAAIIPLLPKVFSWALRLWPGISMIYKKTQAMKSHDPSRVETNSLIVLTSQSNNTIQISVKSGLHAGKDFSQLELKEILLLLSDYRQQDNESAEWTIKYLTMKYPGWYKKQSESMDLKEAREILSVNENSSHAEIIKAHKKLMQKNHPDRGGSDYIARKINLARDVLISSNLKGNKRE